MSTDHGPRFSPESFPGTLIAAGGNPSPSNKTFSIEGSVVDLYPGAHKTLTLRFTNPNNQPIRVTAADVTVQSTNKPGCATAAVTPTNYRPATGTGVVVTKGSSPMVNLPISMGLDADNNCSGAIFSLAYSGTAVQA